jgi:hypothetical protein
MVVWALTELAAATKATPASMILIRVFIVLIFYRIMKITLIPARVIPQ